MFFWFEGKGVDVNADRWNVLVMLITLNQVEVPPVSLAKTVMAIKLEFAQLDWVHTILERNWNVYIVGTTSSHTRHMATAGHTEPAINPSATANARL
jgi:hypothetical protein